MSLPIRKKTRRIGSSKNDLRGKIMKEFVALTPKSYSYIIGDGYVDKKAKGT